MEYYNQTSTDFILLRLFPPSRIGLFFFILVILIFLMSLIGSLSMILLIFPDEHLHTPMYFLLSHLSLVDLNYICTIVPKMASSYVFGNKSISFIGCRVQSFFFLTLAGTETLLLTSMAYDLYVAICFPLHYSIRMSKRSCVLMITGSWITGSINACAHTAYALHIPYCQSRDINHFFCDVPAMLSLACMDTSVYENTVFVCEHYSLSCVSFHRYSMFLWPAVHHMQSMEGRKKSTCSTHLTVVTFYYVPFALHLSMPKIPQISNREQGSGCLLHHPYPWLNSVIYSLRNKEVMGALRRLIQGIISGRCGQNFLHYFQRLRCTYSQQCI